MNEMTKQEKIIDVKSKYVKQSKLKEIWRQFKKNKGAVVGLIVFILIVIIAIASNFIYDFKADITALNLASRLQPPSAAHPFGTDHMGRDVMARILYGSRYSLIIGVVAVAIAICFGTIMGAVAGYFGGRIETIIMRFVEMFLMVPSLLLAIVIVAVFGVSLINLMLALGITTIPYFARNARASVMTVRENEFVEAARAIGAPDIVIIFKHVLPNALSPIMVQASSRVAGCITQAATFSFLGLGVPAPTPEWGAMLSDARQYMREYPHLIIFPGLAIIVTVMAINLIGDGLRDALDPKLKR